MREILKQKYYKVEEDKILVQTRSHYWQYTAQQKLWFLMKYQKDNHQVSVGLGLGQCRAGVRRKAMPISKETPEPAQTRPITHPNIQAQGATSMQRRSPCIQVDIRQSIGPGLETRETPPYINPIMRPPSRPPDLDDNSRPNLIKDCNIDFEENSLHQEGVISETYKSLDKSYTKEPHELADLVDTSKLVQKFLPKQTDMDKILDIIKRKVLKGIHLPITIKDIQASY